MVVHWTRIWLCLIVVFACFLVVGCGSLYKLIGVPQSEIDKLVEDDSVRTLHVVQEGRTMFWQAATAIMGSLGAVASALLGKYLHTERQVSKAVILGVENSGGNDVKTSVAKAAERLEVSQPLAKRVKNLTG